MLKIIVNSYTCCPNMGSEQGMGWNWIINLARYCEVFVISEGEYKDRIETWLEENRNKNSCVERIHFYWNPVSDKVRKMCWNQGDWRFYFYYQNWQKKTAEIARDICMRERIDILHQLNMIGFREPGYFWKVSEETSIPFVWGPVDAKIPFPKAYMSGMSIGKKLVFSIKNKITLWQLKHDKRIRKAAAQASLILSSSSDSQRILRKYLSVDTILMNETGCNIDRSKIVNYKDETKNDAYTIGAQNNPLSILWVGKMDARKKLDIALRAVSNVRHEFVFHVVGSGKVDYYKSLAQKLGIADKCIWHGPLKHSEVQAIMRGSDVLLFTSVAEGTPHVVMESLANGLPIVCFDTCGQGDVVDDAVGRKITLSTYRQSIAEFAYILSDYCKNRQILAKLSENCYLKANTFRWEEKTAELVNLYNKYCKTTEKESVEEEKILHSTKSILINSYTCCPNMGSEQGMGWNWIVSLAKYCECYVVSEGEFRSEVEEWLNIPQNKELADRIHFYWNPVSPRVRKMCWNQGDWRFYKYYKEWQRKTADIARDICKNEKIDVLHQLNMIGFREPGYLWQVSREIGIPFVWGPIGGLKQFPLSYSDGGGLKMKLFIHVKNFINTYQIKHSSRVISALNQANALISSIPDSYNAIMKYHGLKSIIIPETGCFCSETKEDYSRVDSKFLNSQDSNLQIMWVGKFDFRKRLDIAIKAVAKTKRDVRLMVYGSGNYHQVNNAKKLACSLGVEEQIQFMGICSNDDVKVAMNNADLFLFTSVNEDTSTVVLEAISNGLPVLCFDACGMSAVIDETVGRKVQLTTPSQSVLDFAEQIRFFDDNREELKKRSEACVTRAEELSWDNKAKKMLEIYASL